MEGITTVEKKTRVRLPFVLILIGVVIFLVNQNTSDNAFFVEKNYKKSIMMNRPLIEGEVIDVKIFNIQANEQLRIHRCTNDVCSQATAARIWGQKDISDKENSLSYYTRHASNHYIWLEDKEKPKKEGAVLIKDGLATKDNITVTYSSGTNIEITLRPSESVWMQHLTEVANTTFDLLAGELNKTISNQQLSTHYPQNVLSQVNTRLTQIPKASLPELKQIRTLLKDGDYLQLDATIRELYQYYLEDIAYEQKVTTLLSASVTLDPEYEQNLNHFTQALPNSYVPYLLRGIYFNYKGWDARGSKKAKDTTEHQLNNMHYNFTQAQTDFKKVLSMDANVLHAYLYLISSSYHSPKNQAWEFFEAGLKIRPESFTLRWFYQGRLLPRWGGSYSELDSIAENAKNHINKNPLLPILYGRKYADMANIQRRKGDYEKAISYAEAAMNYGQHSLFLKELGDTYYKLGDQPRTRVNYEAVNSHLPFYRKILERRASLYYSNWDYQKCLDTLDVVLFLGKAKSVNYFYKGLCYKELEKHQDATNSFYMAELLDIDDFLEDSASNQIKYYEQQGYTANLKKK
ncbi:MAG: DUF4034 domain-containing protein [Porticoccus sp.]|nr:DUF4034 domain-containing protein [Porticoccus sp.]MBQ0807612.1 DUF4034 domain-containing protein [Porticoccus sp.]